MGRLADLRERTKGRVTKEMDAALSALFMAAPAWLVAHGMAGLGWGWAVLALVAGPVATALAFIVVGALADKMLRLPHAESIAWGVTCVAAGVWMAPRYHAWAALPLAVMVATFAFVLARSLRAPPEGLDVTIADAFAALPEKLPPAVAEPIERALGDHERIDQSLHELAADAAVDAPALRRDVETALRAMVDRARICARLEDAAGGSAPLAAAAADARAQIESLAAQVRAASEALLLYAAARQPDHADALRAATRSLAELAALERGYSASTP